MAHAALTAETPLLRRIFRQRADLTPFDLPHPVRERAILIVIDMGAPGLTRVEFVPVRFLVGVNSASTFLQAAQVHARAGDGMGPRQRLGNGPRLLHATRQRFNDESGRVVVMPVVTEHVPVQDDRVVSLEIREKCLEARILVQNDELVAIDESDPVIFRAVMREAMLVGLELLGAARKAAISVVDEPRTNGDVVPV